MISLQNFKKFLENMYNYKDGNYKLKKCEGSYAHLIKINSEEEMKEKIEFAKQIYSIKIKETGKNMDLSILKNHEFPNLKVLNLKINEINDVSFLSESNFENLEKIDFAKNPLGNNVIDILAKAKLPNLNFLNLFTTEITSIRIFEVIKKYKKLKVFYIGENKFEINEIECNKKIFKFPKTMEEFGITGNFDGNADFVKRLGIENLKILYISRNKLSNLACLKNIIFIRLGEFWAVSNYITDIKEIMNIQGKEFLWRINLKENKINNFNELFFIIKNFPNLKELILTGNNININDAENMEKRIKEKFGFDLKIIV